MYSIDYITNMIMSIDVKISQYETAKTALEGIQTTCKGHVTNLENGHKKLTGNQDLSTVKKNDVFEGQIAEKLSSRISTYQSDMSALITKANDINRDIDTQLSMISTKVGILKQDRTIWENRLQVALNQP